jgi:hypothetical protein
MDEKDDKKFMKDLRKLLIEHQVREKVEKVDNTRKKDSEKVSRLFHKSYI